MNVEVIYTGLCSLLNVRDNHGDKMIEPSIILVRTDVPVDDGIPGPGFQGVPPESHDHKDNHNDNHDDHDHEHVPFLAYDPREMTVDDETFFEDVPKGDPFRFLRLPRGVEIRIEGIVKGNPTVLTSYDTIVKKDAYWPAAKNQWNRDYVPEKGGRPKKSAVVAFMRFGQGFIGGGRLCPFEWKFLDGEGRTLSNQFAEEAIYSFEQLDGDVVIQLVDLESEEPVRELRFTPAGTEDNPEELIDPRLFIGNNMKSDIARAVNRTLSNAIEDGNHFRFLNNVADTTLTGAPFPAIGRRIGKGPSGGSGGSSGACGPHSSNG